MSIQSINSATGEVLENFSETTSAEIERILESGYLTFEQWRHRPFPERSNGCGRLPRSYATEKKSTRERWRSRWANRLSR